MPANAGGSCLAAALLTLAPLGAQATSVPPGLRGEPDAPAEVAVTLQDGRIDESSGLVVRGDRLFTVNDSGDEALVYAVDLRSGETVAVMRYADEDPEDVEALAPGAGGTLWVGDIGDNRRVRGSIRLHRVSSRLSVTSAPAFDLVYPDGPHDAEALLVHPGTGEVLVVTKSLGRPGAVYRAPRRLRSGAEHRLERVATVPGPVTDGAFLPGGDRLVLRTYGDAAVYGYPAFDQLGDVPLPPQEQGEGLAVGDDGRIYLSSEGALSDVLVLDLPPVPSVPPEPAAPGREPAGPDPGSDYDPEPWMGLGPGGLALAAVGAGVALLVLRASLRRSRRRR